MHQLSRRSLLVPVFTAAKPRVASALSRPKVRARALLSARMSVTRYAAAASATRRGDGALRPCAAAQQRARLTAGRRWPARGRRWSARAASRRRCRAPARGRSSRRSRGSARPSALRRSNSASGPSIAPTRTAGTFRLAPSAVRALTQPLKLAVVVLRQVQAGAGGDLRRRIVEQAGRRDQPLLEGQRVDEGLERRAGLAPREHAVDLAPPPKRRRSSRPRPAPRRWRCRARGRRRPRRCGRAARPAGWRSAASATRCSRASSVLRCARRAVAARSAWRAKCGASCSPSGMPPRRASAGSRQAVDAGAAAAAAAAARRRRAARHARRPARSARAPARRRWPPRARRARSGACRTASAPARRCRPARRGTARG